MSIVSLVARPGRAGKETRPRFPDAATTTLVNRLRASVVPNALHGTKAHGYVGGVTAAYIDIGTRVADRLPLFIVLVVLLSFLLLMLVFHSVAIPFPSS